MLYLSSSRGDELEKLIEHTEASAKVFPWKLIVI